MGFLVETRRELPVGLRWNDRDDVAIQQIIAQPVGIEGPVGHQVPSRQTADQRGRLKQVMNLSRHQTEIDEVAERVGQRQNLRRYATARASNGLAMSPPFAPWPDRWTLTMEPSIIAYSRSVSER